MDKFVTNSGAFTEVVDSLCQMYNPPEQIFLKLEIRSVQRGICPIATLFSLAAAYKGVSANRTQLSFKGPSCNQFCPKIRCDDNRGRQGKI